MPLGNAFGRHVRRAALALGLVAATGGFIAVNTAASPSRESADAAALAKLYAASSRGLDVIPFPGTVAAPPGTPILFPTLSPGQIAAVKVVGSRSGAHAGTLSAQGGDHGSQFTPARQFTPGERVTVSASLRSAAAGTAAGAPGSRQLRFTFTVARPASALTAATAMLSPAARLALSPDKLGMTAAGLTRTHASSKWTHSFVTQPKFNAPIINMSGHDSDSAAGNIYLDAQNSGQNAAYMLDKKTDLLWYHPTSGSGGGKGPAAFNVRIQTYNGKPYLTYWEGHLIFPPGKGDGAGIMLNQHYVRKHKVTAGAGYQKQGVDLHEFRIAKDGTAWVTVYAPVTANLKPVGGPAKGTVEDCIAQQIRISDNHVLWEWDALSHVPLTDSELPYTGQPYDYFHMNSIQALSNGHVIISGRHTWAVYSVNEKTGKIDWTLGGKHSTFFRDSGSHLYWQHDAEMHSNGKLSVFDNGSDGATNNESHSRAVQIHLNFATDHATLIQADVHSPPVLAPSMGENQLLFNKNVFVGWGSAPTFSEFDSSGNQLWTASFVAPVDSYRGYRFNNFVGKPLSQPAIAVRSASSGKVKVYESFNGSTQVATWRLLAGASKGSLKQVATKPWSSFENHFLVAKANYFEVQALDSHGNVLPHGTSPVVKG